MTKKYRITFDDDERHTLLALCVARYNELPFVKDTLAERQHLAKIVAKLTPGEK